MDKVIKRGDLVYLNFDHIVGSEQGGPRPAVVVENDMGNKHAPTVIIAPVTSKNKKSNLPTHVSCSIPYNQNRTVGIKPIKENIMKARKPSGQILIIFETDLLQAKSLDEEKLTPIQKAVYDKLSENQKGQIKQGYHPN